MRWALSTVRWPIGGRWSSSSSYVKGAVPPPVGLGDREAGQREILRHLRQSIPEFLPSQAFNRRNALFEELEHLEMIRRRRKIDIPEFYVGSILAVISSVPYTEDKRHRFVGICIQRERRGLNHCVTLRNCIANEGFEIRYDLYNPTIQSVEVLKLEKRLDDELLYLRDALPEYSTVPFDLEPVPFESGQPVPINETKVVLKPPPWTKRWQLRDLKGVQDFWHQVRQYDKIRYRKTACQPWQKFKILDLYKSSVHLEDMQVIVERLGRFQSQTAGGE